MKDFIPHKEALALKELGFNPEDVYGFFSKGGNFHSPFTRGFFRKFDEEGTTIAPLYQQAFRWFREKHRLFVNVVSGEYFTSFNRTKPKMEVISFSRDTENHYEEAELACLRKLIEICQEKKKNL